MEPVSLAVGLIPLIGAAVTGYRSTRKKLKSFCRYSRGVQRIREQLLVQQTIFLNETRLFLRLIVDNDIDARELLRNLETNDDVAVELEDEWEKCLSNSYEACRLVYTSIATANNKLQRQLDPFEDSGAKPRNLSEKACRTKDRIKFAFEEAKCQKLIETLRVWNSDLARIRRQKTELEEPIVHTTTRCCSHKKLPKEFGSFGTIRRAVRMLHQSLVEVYSKPHTTPTQHIAKLFADAIVKEDKVLTDLVMFCSCQRSLDRQIRLIQLGVRSQVDWTGGTRLPTPTSSNASNEGLNMSATTTKRRKMVSWGDTPQSPPQHIPSASFEASIVSESTLKITQIPPNLRQSKNVCSDMFRARKGKLSSGTCLGSLDGAEGYRHTFFPAPEPKNSTQIESLEDFASLAEFLQCNSRNCLSILDQLTLARNVVSAVLKFHQTAWTNEYWTAKDLCFIRKGQSLSKSLQTLHFSVPINSQAIPEQSGSMEGVEITLNPQIETASETLKETMLKYGVFNLTLFGLGVILLQIGRWAVVPDGDIENIRRLAQEPARLGRRFKDLTLRCLCCDFGKGFSLGKPRLQEALYDDVICELSDMISVIDIEDED
ncbi:hypothetical protein F5Y19DRAFT_27279 [Xylariaceae sp. FL1651]|nr:hypothetical protein F5Y19DRAFT_27279 [Xylariaceae sp. FL1651]